MPRGGHRDGSGRKSSQELKTIRTAIDNNISPTQWDTIIQKLFTLAEKGNIRATQILITYRFGAPTAALAESEPEPAEQAQSTPAFDSTYWYLELHAQDDNIFCYRIDKDNCTFDAEGNVIIPRRRLYLHEPPPFIPRQEGDYTSRRAPEDGRPPKPVRPLVELVSR